MSVRPFQYCLVIAVLSFGACDLRAPMDPSEPEPLVWEEPWVLGSWRFVGGRCPLGGAIPEHGYGGTAYLRLPPTGESQWIVAGTVRQTARARLQREAQVLGTPPNSLILRFDRPMFQAETALSVARVPPDTLRLASAGRTDGCEYRFVPGG
jgi:hypothetical protein